MGELTQASLVVSLNDITLNDLAGTNTAVVLALTAEGISLLPQIYNEGLETYGAGKPR